MVTIDCTPLQVLLDNAAFKVLARVVLHRRCSKQCSLGLGNEFVYVGGQWVLAGAETAAAAAASLPPPPTSVPTSVVAAAADAVATAGESADPDHQQGMGSGEGTATTAAHAGAASPIPRLSVDSQMWARGKGLRSRYAETPGLSSKSSSNLMSPGLSSPLSLPQPPSSPSPPLAQAPRFFSPTHVPQQPAVSIWAASRPSEPGRELRSTFTSQRSLFATNPQQSPQQEVSKQEDQQNTSIRAPQVVPPIQMASTSVCSTIYGVQSLKGEVPLTTPAQHLLASPLKTLGKDAPLADQSGVCQKNAYSVSWDCGNQHMPNQQRQPHPPRSAVPHHCQHGLRCMCVNCWPAWHA